METLKHARFAVAVAAFTLLMPLGLAAQDTQPAPDSQSSPNDQDPPGRVARLNYIDGSVSFQPSGDGDWIDAMLNRPLVTGDNLWTDENSRAELHIGSTALRLGEKTGITLLEISDHAVQIRLAMGTLIANVRRVDGEDVYEIDTPNVAFAITQPGDYRVDVSPDDFRTDVTVWRGRGEASGGGSTYTIAANQVATFTGSDRLDYDARQIGDNDAFDSWASERDRREDDSDSGEYVSSDMTGSEDLGNYGDWSYVAEYGYVWRPVGLAPGWAPYRYGRWTWVSPWGWTWVANEPWGFAPFHYGRWAFSGNGWVWVPGSHAVRPVYAPALVAWVGAGAGSNRSSLGSSSGHAPVGWFALAPGEVFVPSYKVSGLYVNRVNTTNTAVTETRVTSVYSTAITNRNSGVNNFTYANRGVEGAVTAVSYDTFVNASPVGRNLVPISAKEVAATANIEPIEPSRVSRLDAGVSVHQPPAAAQSRGVIALRMPANQPLALSPRPQPLQSLVRQIAPGERVLLTPARRSLQPGAGLHAVEENSSGSAGPAKPRVWEEQGTPKPETVTGKQPEMKKTSVSAQQRVQTTMKSSPPAQARPQTRPTQREEKPEYSSWHPQRAAANSQSGSHSSTQSHSSTASPAPPKK
ncbi:MAG TPA: DUF6600 domain-containing protein [Candidatus Sulfotelmatobacter sp.]